MEEEAVHLRFGQGKGALVLDRVLGGATIKGSGSRRVTPAVVTCPSAIASRSADCTLGGARLISSTSTRAWKIGPGWKSKRPVSGRNTCVPVRSAGSRSGVHWMRAWLPG